MQVDSVDSAKVTAIRTLSSYAVWRILTILAFSVGLDFHSECDDSFSQIRL